MSRPPKIPSYRLHKQSGQAVVTLTDGLGGRRDKLLGQYGSAESRAAYATALAEWEANRRRFQSDSESLSVNELLLRFIHHADQHYRRPDGTHTSEPRDFRAAIKPLKEMYGLLPVADFGPLKLKAVRQRMIDADLSRGVVNQRVRRIVRVFKWGVGEELVSESVWRSLTTIRGLEKGRSPARETEPVQPVAVEVVEATLPYLLPPVRALAELQLVTGMRPGEVCLMRGCDLDTSGDVWLFRPASHKTQHRGKERVVAIGPRGQEIIKPFLRLETTAYLFSPREAIVALRVRQRSERKSKVQPSQQDRSKRKPRKQPGDRYQSTSYSHAVAKAIQRANTLSACDGCKELRPAERCAECKAAAIPHWHPHQIRHHFATVVRRQFGLEGAQVSLGHSQAAVTEVYAERDLTLASKVARQIG